MEFSGKKVTVVGTGISGIGAVGTAECSRCRSCAV